nr:hypothetical protein [uncultured Desulfobacter sp.]
MTYLYLSLGLGLLALVINIFLIGKAERLIAYLKTHHPKQVKSMGSLRFYSRGSKFPSVNPKLTSFVCQRRWQQLNDPELAPLCRAMRTMILASRIIWALFALSLIGMKFFTKA